MKTILSAFLLLSLSLTHSASAQEKAKSKARPQVKLTTATIQQSEQVYKKTAQGELKMHLFFPPDWKATDERPGIVFFFGGGWKGGSYTQFVPQAEYLASRGMVAACADYRIESIHKTTPDCCVEDAKSAVRWLRSKARELGIHPNKIVGSGGSAGGHLAASTAFVPGMDSADDDTKISCQPNVLVLFNPALNLTGKAISGKDGKNIAEAISPTRFLQAGAPPAIIFFGTADAMLAQGEEFVKQSKSLSNRVELQTAAEMPHGFFNRSPWNEVTALSMDRFLVSVGYLSGEPTIALPKDAPSLKSH